MVKGLVAYFSPTGTTARIAQRIAKAAEADLFEIVPEQPYTDADLNWHDNSSRSSLEMADEASRPAIASKVEGMNAYDVVYVGFPIWWYVEPRIIDTFLESYDFAGKRVVPFATSGGSGMGQAPEHMQQLCAGAEVEGARVFRPTDDDAVLYQWVGPFVH